MIAQDFEMVELYIFRLMNEQEVTYGDFCRR
jgi:hypothetical protein